VSENGIGFEGPLFSFRGGLAGGGTQGQERTPAEIVRRGRTVGGGRGA
jgi:hypothetical protein